MKRAVLSLMLIGGLSLPILADAPPQLGQIGGAVKRAQQVRDLVEATDRLTEVQNTLRGGCAVTLLND